MIVDPTAPSYVRRGLDEATLIRECEVAKRNKHVLNGATMVLLVLLLLGLLRALLLCLRCYTYSHHCVSL